MNKNTFHRAVQWERYNFSWAEVTFLLHRRMTWTGELICYFAVEFWWPTLGFCICEEENACLWACISCVCFLIRHYYFIENGSSAEVKWNCWQFEMLAASFVLFMLCNMVKKKRGKRNGILCFIAIISKVNVAISAKCFHWNTKSQVLLLRVWRSTSIS